MDHHAETLGDLEVYQPVRVTLEDDTTVEGQANPIDYVPEESLRVEVKSAGETNVRYQFSAEYDGGWSDVEASKLGSDDEGEWIPIGTVADVEPLE